MRVHLLHVAQRGQHADVVRARSRFARVLRGAHRSRSGAYPAPLHGPAERESTSREDERHKLEQSLGSQRRKVRGELLLELNKHSRFFR